MRFLTTLALTLALPLAALAGTTNIPGRLIVQTDDGAPTCSTAAADGTLCVESATELQSSCAIAGNATVGGTLAVTGAATLSSTLTTSGALDVGEVTCDSTILVEDETLPQMLLRDTTAPGDASGIASIKLQANDDASVRKDMAHFSLEVTDASAGAHTADVLIRTAVGGTLTTMIRADGSDNVVKMLAGIAHNNATSLPATCVVGEVFLDTDSDDCADTGAGDGCLCICKTANTWAVIQDI